MKFVITVIIIVGLSLGAWQFYQYYSGFKEKEQPAAAVAPTSDLDGLDLPGMPNRLQSTLEAAQKRGATGLHDFLSAYGKTISDPRLAWIQLDYVVLVAQSNPAEARKVFAQVQSRTSPGSPVYSRVKQLEKTYQP